MAESTYSLSKIFIIYSALARGENKMPQILALKYIFGLTEKFATLCGKWEHQDTKYQGTQY